MTLTCPEMLAKLDIVVGRLDDLFTSVDNISVFFSRRSAAVERSSRMRWKPF